MTTHRITHKVILRADLELLSPLRIGNGDGEYTQLAILRDANGNPYLPGSSIAGVLRARWLEEVILMGDQPLLEASRALWGSTATEDRQNPKKSSQSHFFVADMPIVGGHRHTTVRDGVRIDAATGTVDGSGKYDYELLEPGARFQFQAEVTLREEIDPKETLRIVQWMEETLQADLQVGGNTTKGFGRLKATNIRSWLLDFKGETGTVHADAWISYCKTGEVPRTVAASRLSDFELKALSLQRNELVHLSATFSLRSSIIIGGEGSNDLDTDKAHLTSAGRPIISGKSLVGAMRQRATRIVQTLNIPDQELVDLFGPLGGLDENQNPKKLQRSRLYADEADLTDAGKHRKQTRIRLDRFTAAPVDGGLFDSAPLWQQGDGRFTLNWRIRKPKPYDIALLLHLLRDLWTGDLAIGGEKNVGRGVLMGHNATLTLADKKTVVFAQEGSKLTITGQDHLTPYNLPLKELISTPQNSKTNE